MTEPLLWPGASVGNAARHVPFPVGLTFEHPAWLLLLLLAAPAAWAGLRWFSSMSRVRRVSAVLLRVVLIALITAMLAGASAVRKTDKLAVIGVVDVSGSVRLFGRTGQGQDGKPLDPLAAARAFIAAAEKARGPDDLLGLVIFDGRPLAVAMPTRAEISDRSIDLHVLDGTDIAAALRYAAALVPPDAAGRLALISDGDQTSGDAISAARELAGRATGGARGGTPVDVAPVELDASQEVMVESVDSPPRSAAESAVMVRVTFMATEPVRGLLTLMHSAGGASTAGEPIDINGEEPGFARRVELPTGRSVQLIRVQLPAGHVHQFRAVFEPETGLRADGTQGPIGDTRLENNSGETFTYTPGKGSVLLIDGVSGGAEAGAGSTLAGVLRDAGIDVTVIPPEGIPDNLLALQAYDLVILENVPADAVPEETQKALADHVRQMGAGLVMIGGPESFGAGGWKGSVLEPLLPVKLDLPERLVEPDAAVVFVLDNSGSMGRSVLGSTYSQQEIANQSAAMAVKSLAKTDLVGVVVFNSDTEVLTPLGPNTNADATADRILSIAPGGGTVLGPALEEARGQLRDAKAAVKHVIVLSDGRSMDPGALPGICARMRDEGITVSTIAVGDEADEKTMGDMAAQGHGRFYSVSNPSLLPQFFLKAVRIIRTPYLSAKPFTPVILPTPSPLTAGLSDPPALGGMVLTQRRPEPTITYAMQAPSGEPLLAQWTVELGQVAAFTSDANLSGWASQWTRWPGYRALWTQAARTLARAASNNRMELTTQTSGGVMHLRLDAAADDGRPLDLLTVPGTVRAPSGEEVKVNLAQTAPGVYEADTPAAEGGSYIAILTPRLSGKRLAPVIGGVSVTSGLEYRTLKTNTGLLEAIARETGGRVLDLSVKSAGKLFDRSGMQPTLARTPLWRPLLLWTLMVMLLDVATRRIAWDRFVSREFGAGLREVAEHAVKDRGREAQRAVTRLREAPKRVQPAAAGAVLTNEDADRLAEEAKRKRQEARLAALQAARTARREEAEAAAPGAETQPAPSAEPQPAPEAAPTPAVRRRPPAPAPDKPPEAGVGDLMAAKRRALERFEEEQGGPGHKGGRP